MKLGVFILLCFYNKIDKNKCNWKKNPTRIYFHYMGFLLEFD